MADGDAAKATQLMLLAVERLAASDFHMGRSDKSNGVRYCDWEKHLFSTAERFQRWLAEGER